MKLICLFIFLQFPVFAQDYWQKHPSPTNDVWYNAFFVSEKTGWAISHQTGLVLQTKNGGKSWRINAKLGEGYLESIYFSDRQNGWIVGESGRIFQTSDGGKTWKLIDSFARTNAFSAIHFFDKNHGFVFGTDTETRQGIAFETRDSGKSWSNRSVEIKDKPPLSDAIFRFDKSSFIVGGRSFLTVENGKKDFDLVENKQSGAIRGLFFIDRKNGFAVGHRGLILQTGDGGQNWTKQESFTETILRSVVFINSQTGFIVGNRDDKGVSLWQTKDGGKTWEAAKMDFPNLHRIVSTKKTVWMFGANGTIFSFKLATD